jgi:programmed cell death protein 4
MLLKEYLLSRQLDEAAQCIKDLGSPPFHHEVIKRAVKTAIDSRRSDEDSAAISRCACRLSLVLLPSKVL